VGGPLDIEKGIIYAPIHLPNWDNIYLKDLLSDKYNLPVYVEHDGNAGALAEFYFGAGQGSQNIIFLTMGTGLGAGIIFDGQIYRGTTDCAGEVGFIRMDQGGSHVTSWEDSWESYCCAKGLVRLAHKRFPEVWDEQTAAREIIQKALRGDPIACEIISESGSWLGRGLAILVNILNPERIIVGTLGVLLGDLLLDPARKRMRMDAIPRAAEVCEIVPSQLGEQIGDVAALMAVIHASKTHENFQQHSDPSLQSVITALQAGIDVRTKTIATLPHQISQAAEQIITTLENRKKILLCGNGGSAAAAQHLAGELCGRYQVERRPLAAIALTADSSVITCIGNDYDYEDIFSRQVEALGQSGDTLIAFSTSGKSPNVIKAINTAKEKGLSIIAMTGENGLHGSTADCILAVPSKATARIQEEHDGIIHAICDLIDIRFSDLA
jgi:glucokinase